MIVLYLTGAAVFLSISFYLYGAMLAKRRGEHTAQGRTSGGRDMWVATLLDCDFEPAKVRFGPAKVIPANKVVARVSHKKEFSDHMYSK
jgi:hypothetical protein